MFLSICRTLFSSRLCTPGNLRFQTYRVPLHVVGNALGGIGNMESHTHPCMHQTGISAHANEGLHPEMSLFAFTRLVHL